MDAPSSWWNLCSHGNQMRNQRKGSEAVEPLRWHQWCRSGTRPVLFFVRKEKWTWELEEITIGRLEWKKLSTPASKEDKISHKKTLGLAGGQNSHAEAWQCGPPHDVFGKHGHQGGVRWGQAEAWRKNSWTITTPHGWLISALLLEMSGLEGQAMFECVESTFSFNRRLRQGSVETPIQWLKMVTQLLANMEENWTRRRKGIFSDLEGQRVHPICSFMWADNFWIMSHSKGHLEQMPRELVGEAGKWNLAAKPASLWWTSAHEDIDLPWNTMTGRQQISSWREFKIFGCAMNRQGKTDGCERIRSANKAWWRDVKIHRNKDVPWRVKCRRTVENVYSVFCFGSENWYWSQENFGQNQRKGNKDDESFLLIQKGRRWDVSNVLHKNCQVARNIWNYPFCLKWSPNVWRALGWACGDRLNAVINTLRWRSRKWWQSTWASVTKSDPHNDTRWKHKCGVAWSTVCLGQAGYRMGR